ncbi:MAG: carboxy-S-adenosyl-L-methionine synthase CmoA [Desulfobacterales bacterium]|nr:carboxy-S-adenosyl-L-methionine synthase CmoA [Desulfobacterales bacterium]MDJ0874365.1 carboxy-S-adenosyl-L-methionine synthase CmoA [Desulfobacterales bacterium]
MKRDTLYDEPRRTAAPFEFNRSVAAVFDDMIQRSVPLYAEILNREAQLIATHYQRGTRIYDLGCSTGNLGVYLCRNMGAQPFEMIAVDSAAPMLEICAGKLADAGAGGRVTLVHDDIGLVALENASVIVLNFTLQFLPLTSRDRLLARIFDALVPGGILLLAEKTIHADDDFNRLRQDCHHRFKQENGYSALAVAQKREALETVLIPESEDAHGQRISAAGFGCFDIWLKWFNFSAWIGRK